MARSPTLSGVALVAGAGWPSASDPLVRVLGPPPARSLRAPASATSWRELCMADGHEVQGSVERCLILALEREVGGGDRGNEALVERLRQAQRRVEAVPAEAERDLVQAEGSRVGRAQELDPSGVGLEERAG